MSAVDVTSLPPATGARGTVVTVGTFDGVHRGHQVVLRELVGRGRAKDLDSVLVTFDPHPLSVVRPGFAPPLLTTLAEKVELIAATGIDRTLILHFTPELQQYPARRFVDEILLDKLAMRELVIGHDHGFGRGREGSVEVMQQLGAELGFEVDVIPPVQLDDQPISSTRIRTALEAGDVADAQLCLGRPYSLSGIVVRGFQRGRDLGFPTANVQVDSADKILPAPGIYTAYGKFADERVPGLLHLGPRPTFPGAPPSVELYLLDWSGDLYGMKIVVEFHARLRGVEAFDTPEALVAQMRRDEIAGRALLAGSR